MRPDGIPGKSVRLFPGHMIFIAPGSEATKYVTRFARVFLPGCGQKNVPT
jgi:hypothetical protein